MKSVSLIGIPLDLGARNLGVDIAPDAFRRHHIIEKLAGSDLAVKDLGNIDVLPRDSLEPGNDKLRYADEIVRVAEATAKKTKAVLADGPIIGLGGDHSVTLGLVTGAAEAAGGSLGLIYFDAHGDMNTDQTTPTGNIHGMHLAALMGVGADKLTGVGRDKVKVRPEHLLHIGGSDFDTAETELVNRLGIQHFSLFDMLSHGLAPLLGMIEELSRRVDRVWVSLDFDAIDSVYAPGAGMPSKAGLSYREIIALADFIGRKVNVIGLDLVEYNPLQDIDHKTAELGIELVAKFLGTNYSWYTNYLEQNKLG